MRKRNIVNIKSNCSRVKQLSVSTKQGNKNKVNIPGEQPEVKT